MREVVSMEKTTLKASEIEALTFVFTPDAPPQAGGGFRRDGRLRARPAAVGLTAAVAVLAALAWLMFSR
jgi:hypothetical protein